MAPRALSNGDYVILSVKAIVVAASVFALGVTAAANAPAGADTPNAIAKPAAGEQIKWRVVSGGGNRSSSGSIILTGTVGQTAAGMVSNSNYQIYQGFWQSFVIGSCCTTVTTGDVDASASVDISDLSAMVDYLFNSLPFPGACFQEQDVDRSLAVDISDLQAIIDFLFNSVDLPSCS